MDSQLTIEERVASLEGAYGHLATKADLAEFRGDVREALADLRTEIAKSQVSMLRWMVGLGVAHAGIVVGVIIAVAR